MGTGSALSNFFRNMTPFVVVETQTGKKREIPRYQAALRNKQSQLPNKCLIIYKDTKHHLT